MMGSSTKVFRGLRKAQWISPLVGAAGYLGIQEIRNMDVGPEKEAANAGVAGAVSGITIASNLISIIDNLVLMHKYWDRLDAKDNVYLCIGIVLSLAVISYTAFNFLDQRHTGIVALANTMVLGLNTFFRKNAVKLQEQDEFVLEQCEKRGSQFSIGCAR